MAFQSTWYFTRLPQQVVDILDKEVTEEGTIPDTNSKVKNKRNKIH